MKLGILTSGRPETRAIAPMCQKAGHEVRILDPKTVDGTVCQDLEVVVVACAPDPVLLRSLLLAIEPRCHLIHISSYSVLPSGPVSIPWSEDDFDVTLEAPPDAGTASQAARAAERLLFIGGNAHRWTILRPAIVEGPSDPDPTHTRWFVDRLLLGGVIVLPDGDEQLYGHVSTRDLASAVVTVIDGGAEVYNRVLHVCSDSVLSPTLHARAVTKALEVDADLRYVPEEVWEYAGLPRPMAGRSGSALLAPSPILRKLGWKPTPPLRYITNLSRELAAQPRQVREDILAREQALDRNPTFHTSIDPELAPGWMLRTSWRQGPTLDLVPSDTAHSGPWTTIAVALGEEVERNVSALAAARLERNLVAPLLAGRLAGGSWQAALAFERQAREAIEAGDDLVPAPAELGVLSLLAAPLARLLMVWPTDAPPGDAWIMGRGIEALFASWLARDEGRATAVLGAVGETTGRSDVQRIEALDRQRSGQPALVINVSAAPEGEAIAAHKLVADGMLITPFLRSSRISKQYHLVQLPSIPSRAAVEQAFERIKDWRNRLDTDECLFRVSSQSAPSAFAGPAFRLPILVSQEFK